MTKRDILSIACKVIGIYFVMYIICWTEFLWRGIYYALLGKGHSWDSVATFLLYLPLLVAAVFLIKWADGIAAKLVGPDENVTLSREWNRATIQEVAFQIVGVFIIVESLPVISQIAWQFHSVSEIRWEQQMVAKWAVVVRFVVQIAIGLVLIFGARRLSRLLTHRAGELCQTSFEEAGEGAAPAD